jgi:putative SOS response-associated peptidase YedK
MPVILNADDYDQWLDPAFTRVEALKELLRPLDATLMKGYPVSKRVNLVKNDDPDCAVEISLVPPMRA